MPASNPEDRSQIARIGGYSLHAKRDSKEVTAPARAAFLSSFEKQVDPEGLLSEKERQRRAKAARKAYFAKLALRSAQARRKAKAS